MTPLQRKPRTKNPEHTRAKLFQAAVDLVAQKGADALEMKEVARTAKVSRAMAYRHFGDREQLLREAKRWLSDRLLESVTDVESASIEDQVYRAAIVVLGNIEASRLWLADALSGKPLDTQHPLYVTTVRTLQEFSASGHARDKIDAEVLTSILLSVVAMLVLLRQQQEGASIEELARRFATEWTRILSHGLIAESGVPAGALRSQASKPASARSKTRASAKASAKSPRSKKPRSK